MQFPSAQDIITFLTNPLNTATTYAIKTGEEEGALAAKSVQNDIASTAGTAAVNKVYNDIGGTIKNIFGVTNNLPNNTRAVPDKGSQGNISSLLQGATNFIQTAAASYLAIKNGSANAPAITAPATIVSLAPAALGSQVSAATPQYILPSNSYSVTSPTSTQGAQATSQPNYMWLWILLAIIAIVLFVRTQKG